ncbi:asparaginase [Rhodanobacter sp. C05]|nr:asparaginase [Rhodanobacter sp. C05]
MSDPLYRLLIKLQHRTSISTFAFWEKKHCQTLHLPITTNAVSSPMGLGSDSLPVSVDLFGQPTYLADSMQFMLEYGCRFNEAGCFYLMPSFRGEDTDTTHLSQFYHSEVELQGDLVDAMDVADEYFRHVVRDVLSHCRSDLEQLVGTCEHLDAVLAIETYPRITFEQADSILGHNPEHIKDNGKWRTLTRPGELALIQHFQSPLWVTHWDHLSVPFYQAYADEDGYTACNADFLLGFGEVIGLGERHESEAEVRRALAQHDVAADPYQWYLDMKKHYPMKTAGFGMGVERFLLWVLDHGDIRDLQLLPRANGRNIIP